MRCVWMTGLLVLTALIRSAAAQVRDTTVLDPIVVSATRAPASADRLGHRVTVLTEADLRASGYTTVGEALAGLAGLTIAPTSGPGSATSLFLRGGESDYVKVLVDGIPLNEPGGAYDFAHLTLDNVQRIEVVRGPASVLYGSDAVSGVVQLFTRAGGTRYQGTVRGGAAGTVEAGTDVAGDVGPLSYALAGAWRQANGLYPVNSGYENGMVAGRLRLVADPATSADVTVRHTSAEYRYPTDGAGNVVDVNQRQRTTSTALGLTVVRALGARVSAHLALRGHAIGGGLDDPVDGPADTVGAYQYESNRDLDRRLVDLWMAWRPLAGLTVTTGGGYEYQRDRSTDAGQSTFGPYGSTIDARRHNWAGYGEAQAARGPLAFTLGGRVDRNERFGTFVTWRTGASVTTRVGLRVFASGGSAFKEPTMFEQYGGSYVVGNPDLAPERSVSWEGGVEQTLLGGRLRASVSYFGQRFRDLIQYSYAPVTPGNANYLNLAAADAEGIEIEGRAVPVPGLHVTAQYTWLHTSVVDAGVLPEDDAAFRQGDRLLRRPTHAAALETRWDGDLVQVRGALRWTGARADADFAAYPATRVELPPYVVVDAGLTIRPVRARTAFHATGLELQARNLLGADYQIAYGFPAQGRVVLFGIRLGAGN